jgi:hypothetical protein
MKLVAKYQLYVDSTDLDIESPMSLRKIVTTLTTLMA